MGINDRLKQKGIVSVEYIGGSFDRMATYQANGTLKITEYPDLVEGQGWPPAQEVVLRNWEEIERLRDYLNSLAPVSVKKEVTEEKHYERATA